MWSPEKWSPLACPRPPNSAGSGALISWNDHLNPQINKKNWTPEDTLKLFELQRVFNSKWSLIAPEFNQRSATFLKNTFFLSLRKVLRKLAKSCSRPISSADLKTLQPKILTEFLWSDFDLGTLGPNLNVSPLRMIDLFKMIIVGDIKQFHTTFNHFSRPLADAIFTRLYCRKWVNQWPIC
jgi:hypothetical protein